MATPVVYQGALCIRNDYWMSIRIHRGTEDRDTAHGTQDGRSRLRRAKRNVSSLCIQQVDRLRPKTFKLVMSADLSDNGHRSVTVELSPDAVSKLPLLEDLVTVQNSPQWRCRLFPCLHVVTAMLPSVFCICDAFRAIGTQDRRAQWMLCMSVEPGSRVIALAQQHGSFYNMY